MLLKKLDVKDRGTLLEKGAMPNNEARQANFILTFENLHKTADVGRELASEAPIIYYRDINY